MVKLKFVVCPDCKGKLLAKGKFVVCSKGHKYIVDNDIVSFSRPKKFTAGETFGEQFSLYYDDKFELDTWYARTPRQEFDCLNNSLKPKSGSLLLNAGFGNHTLLREIGRNHKNINIIGIDAHTKIPYVKDKLEGYDNITLYQADIFNLPFKDNTFDGVWCSGVVHHTPNPRKAFDKLCGVTKKGGRLYTLIYGDDFSFYLSMKKLFPRAYKMKPKRLYSLSTVLAFIASPLIFFGRIVRALRRGKKINFSFSLDQVKFSIYDSISCKYLYRYSVDEIKSWYKDNSFTFEHLGRWNYVGKKK